MIRQLSSFRMIPLSDVVSVFSKLHGKYQQLFSARVLTAENFKIIKGKVTARQEFIVDFVHTLAYVLDPRYYGVGLTRDQRKAVEDYVCDYKTEQEKAAAYKELNCFIEACINFDPWRKEQLKKRGKTALQFWLMEGAEWPYLKKLAVPVFHLAASSAASERCFSSLRLYIIR